MATRRRFLKNSVSAAALPLIGTNTKRPTFDVDIYVGANVDDAQNVNRAARYIEDGFGFLNVEMNVGPAGVVTAPAFDTAKGLAEWWASVNTGSEAHTELLFLDTPDHEITNYGYAHRIGKPACVALFASRLGPGFGKWLTLHEVAHTLGAHHGNASEGTILNGRWDRVDRPLQFSQYAKQVMKRHL